METRNLLVEVIGTFFLVLVIGLSGSPIAIGLVLVALVYMGGPISGAHYNPAITLAAYVCRQISSQKAIAYVTMQVLGAVLAAAAYYVMRGSYMQVNPGAGVGFAPALLAEVLFTFLLVFTVLQTAMTKKTAGNPYFGLAIGLVVLAGAASVGPISGGAFNPAVGLGPVLVRLPEQSILLQNIGLYLLGPVLGAALASMAYRLTTTK